MLKVAIALAFAGAAASEAPAQRHELLPTVAIARQRFGNDAPWFLSNIPFFDSSDPALNEIYYYRWKVLRAHIRDVGQGRYVFTEFLQDMTWDRDPYSTLNDSAVFPIYDGRWLRDRRYIVDWIDYLWIGGGNDRHFSESIADATYRAFLVNGDKAAAVRNLPEMVRIYDQWDDHYDAAKHLYWIEPINDATEYSIASIDASGGKDGFRGGAAFRPSINSYMFANARAIGRIALLAGDTETAERFAGKAADLRKHVEQSLWDGRLKHFTDRYKTDNRYVHYWQPIRGRELVGYTPWLMDLPDNDPRFASSWTHILRSDQLRSSYGLRTVEPSYQYYMRQYRYDSATGRPECQWNGPIWPFQTTQVLMGLANLLNDYTQSVMTRSDYASLLAAYTKLHYDNGHPDIQEDYNPATGRPIVGLFRSHHYYHSSYDDLIISGLVGIRPRADDTLELNPLVPHDPRDPAALSYFALTDVPYHGHLVSVLYDRNGGHYRRGTGLQLFVDGKRVAQAAQLDKLTAKIAQRALPPVHNTVDVAVNLARTEFPHPSASVNGSDRNALLDSVDGRLWFFPEVQSGWTTQGSTADTDWFELDLGAPSTIGASETYFLDDGSTFAAPRSYRIAIFDRGNWRFVGGAAAIANGVNHLDLPELRARKIRLYVRQSRVKRPSRLVEWKLLAGKGRG